MQILLYHKFYLIKRILYPVNYSATSCRASCIIHYCSTATRRLTAEPYKMSAGVRYDNIREKFFETEYISLEDFSYGLLV